MQSLKGNGAVLVLLASLGTLGGCAGAGVGFPASEEQRMVSDLVTERVITRAFFNEPQLAGTHIIVGCVDGIVTLSGDVQDPTQAALAERVARGVEGVTDVRNSITSS